MERALRGVFGRFRAGARGYRAWARGHLEEAEADLRAALEQRPSSAGARLYLARVLSERGQLEEALSTLEGPLEPKSAESIRAVFRGIILYDHGDPDGAREALRAASASNVLARAFEALMGFSEALARLSASTEPSERTAPGAPAIVVPLPLSARYVSDVSGRALALLEEAFLRQGERDWREFHHRYLTEEPEKDSGDAKSEGEAPDSEATVEAPRKERRRRVSEREAWMEDLDRALERRDYEEFERISRSKDVPRDWFTPEISCFRAFALVASAKAERAVEILEPLAGEQPGLALIHFVLGLAQIRLGRRREAGWCFCRAARFADISVDELVQGISKKLGVEWRYEDP